MGDPSTNLRDKLIICLYNHGLQVRHLHVLQLEDVVMDANHTIYCWPGKGMIPVQTF